jgi:lexA repressor|nr:MAG TPA: Repressor protein CI [Caudoviricetes sp.]
MSISKRIKTRRQELGISVEELADRINKNKATIYRYEKGDIGKVPYDILEPLSEALDVSIGYLLGSEDTIEERPLPSNLTPITKVNRIPIVGSIAAGKPILATENIDSYLLLGQEYKADFALKIMGDSMIDVGINDGDLALIIKDKPIINGDIYAVLVDGDATLKKVYKNDDYLTLQPCNSKYEPIMVKEEDNPYIIGKLSGIVRKY